MYEVVTKYIDKFNFSSEDDTIELKYEDSRYDFFDDWGFFLENIYVCSDEQDEIDRKMRLATTRIDEIDLIDTFDHEEALDILFAIIGLNRLCDGLFDDKVKDGTVSKLLNQLKKYDDLSRK